MNVLLSKLSRFWLVDEFLELLSSYVKYRPQLLNFCGYGNLSKTISLISGVVHGSVLDPLLFLKFTNDLPAIFLELIRWLFADDLMLLFRSLNIENDIARLAIWNFSNGLIANVEKTKCLLLTSDVSTRSWLQMDKSYQQKTQIKKSLLPSEINYSLVHVILFQIQLSFESGPINHLLSFANLACKHADA